MAVVASIWSSLGISRPQSKVLRSASKDVNSAAGLSAFYVVAYKNILDVLLFLCSHSALPTKMANGILFIFYIFVVP